ncbi:hypothetical protein [Kribbella sindirgiensis]|uniref:hypothetical protein n=1 Tax=Kribbella sindirgiensis TaxID=1124744 RepID=UPI00192D8BFF|nr:hypothetical protein [Kribbella sindirgiensis]
MAQRERACPDGPDAGASGYADLSADARYLVDKFLARSLGYQTRMLALVEQLALNHLDVTGLRSPEQLTNEILDSVERSLT